MIAQNGFGRGTGRDGWAIAALRTLLQLVALLGIQHIELILDLEAKFLAVLQQDLGIDA